MKSKNIIIIGAGFAGTTIAAEIGKKGVLGRVIGFLDDDERKIGTTIRNIPVLGPIGEAARVSEQYGANEALIAIPSADRKKLEFIYSVLKKAGYLKIRILPSVSQIIDGDAHFIQTREIDAQDLLGRNPVMIPLKESLRYLRGRRVVITGAGGSIGSELARQLLSGGAERLYLFGHGENSIYEIERELKILQEEGVGEKASVVPVIGELRDRDFVKFIMKRLDADVIFHCAAYKHVPLMESNPIEAVKNNVFGTKTLVEAALEAEISRFVFISTDKAVQPVSVYGVSKLIAEEIVLENNTGSSEFIVVRFGNVLGSRGSIVPLLRKQILKGGPVTITDPNISRFFMTIPEAASLVLKAGGVGKGGNLYILDMGEPIRIKELAEQMVRFYGFTPHDEIEFKYIGLRPGEKLNEQLWTEHDRLEPTEHVSINRLDRNGKSLFEIEKIIAELRPFCYFDKTKPHCYRNKRMLRETLADYVPTLEVNENEPEY
jgi:FlaA1/EpsC-like NDP-sugar epimerase